MGDSDQGLFNWLVETRTEVLKSTWMATEPDEFEEETEPEQTEMTPAEELEIRSEQVRQAEEEAERLRAGLMVIAEQYPETRDAVEKLLGVELTYSDAPNVAVPAPMYAPGYSPQDVEMLKHMMQKRMRNSGGWTR